MNIELTLVYILSQIFTVISYAALAITYVLKNKKAIATVSLLAPTALFFAYLLLGAWTGLAMDIIALSRNVYIFWDESKHGKRKSHQKRDYIFLAVIFSAVILLTIPTYDGPMSLLPVAATFIYTFGLWQKSPKVYKLLGIPTEGLGMLYNVYIGSFFGVLAEATLLVVATIGLITDKQKKKRLSRSVKR